MRIRKFAKYLPQFNWQPIVLTSEIDNPDMMDKSLFEDFVIIPEIHRIALPFPKSLIRLYRRHILKYKVEESVISNRASKKKGFKKRIIHLFEQLFLIPDNRVFWIPFAIVKGIRYIKKNRVDIILSTSPPHSTHIIALFLSRLSGKPLIVDFRDEWIGNPHYVSDFKFSNRVERFLEKHVVAQSRYVIANTAYNYESFKKRYPRYGNRFVTITNGFDEMDFDGLTHPPQHKDVFKIVYTGSLSIKQRPVFFFEALAEAVGTNPDLAKTLEVMLIGPVSNEHRTLIKEKGLEPFVNITGAVSYKECLEMMFGADILLLILDLNKGADGIVPAKTYEYLRVGKPILATVREGLCANLVRELNVGRVVPFDRVSEISKAIEQHFDEWKNNRNPFNRLELSQLIQYNRQELTRKLATYLDHAA